MRRLLARGFGSRARFVLRRSLLPLVVLSLLASLVVAGAPWERPVEPGEPVAVAPDEASASLAAMRQGSRVEVASLRSETATTYANPDGSWTLDQSVGPVRVRRGDGWVPVDTSLGKTSDGTFATRATSTAVEVSGGGRAALARASVGDKGIALFWPSVLPRPEVDGSVATYRDVLPGVDLRVRATDQGFGHDVVVKTREAAANPKLSRIRLGLSTTGVALRADRTGNLSASDESGEVVFHAPAPMMWDSSDPRIERLVGVEVDANSVTLLPDLGMLRDPSTQFPVTIDPTYSGYTPNARNSWTLVRRSHPGISHWNRRPQDEDERLAGVARVGHAPGWPPEYLDRSLFAFDTRRLAGTDVVSARFRIWQVWKFSNSCNPSDVDPMHLWQTGGIDSTTKWNNQPRWIQHLSSVRSVPKANYCDPAWVGMNATAGTQSAANNGSPTVVLGLRANDETGDSGWKRFYVQNGTYPMLSITYNHRPTVSGVGMEPRLVACVWCDGVPWIGNTSLNLVGTVHDRDGGQVTANFRIRKPTESRVSQNRAAGHKAATQLVVNEETIKTGTAVTWDVAGTDGALGTGPVNGPSFMVDNKKPTHLPDVKSELYDDDDNRWHGGVGVADTFTFSSADTDIDHYIYGWQYPPTTKAIPTDKLGGSASVRLAPTGDGPQTLYVGARDRAGNPSPITAYRIYVRAGNGPYAQWPFEGNARDTAFLGDRHGTLNGDASFGDGAVGTAVHFEGGAGSDVTAPNAVSTEASFSVMSWVRLTDGAFARAAVSQDGVNFPGFVLWYRPENGGRWGFGMAKSDDTYAGTDQVLSPATAQLNTWTHLAGVYDARAGELRFYVNGELAGSAPRSVLPWNATGLMRIGQMRWQGNIVDPWAGAVDEVRVYDRAVEPAEVKAAVGTSNVQVAHWTFDEAVELPDPGRTARNAVQGGPMAVLEGDARFVEDGVAGGGAVEFGADGGAGWVTTNAPTVRTDQSFSVAAWVQLRDLDLADRAAICQDGSRISGFCLGHAETGRWTFGMPGSDADNPSATASVVSGADEEVTTKWTHLVGVHDATTQRISLYVDGELEGTASHTSPWPATGPFRIGQAQVAGQPQRSWDGLIDEVRVYSRVISPDEIQAIVSQDDVAAGTWKLDGDATDSAQDLDGTVAGDPAWTAGQSTDPVSGDLALLLTGATDEYVRAPAAVDTEQSFSVTAWARVDEPEQQAVVVSQDGSQVSGFTLRSLSTGQWSFGMHATDANGAQLHQATGGAVQVGVWTHLVGVYRTFVESGAVRGQLDLYVNGDLVASASDTASFTAEGDLQIGRGRHDGGYSDHFTGAIDDVSVYSRPLLHDQIRVMAGRDLSLVHHWRLDEASGTNAADAVGSRGGTLSGGAAFGDGRVANAVHLNGGDGVVSTSGVDLRTDESFSVAAWVYLDSTADAATAVSLDGTHTSKFQLGYRPRSMEYPFGQWVFEMPVADTAGSPDIRAAVSTRQSEVRTWVHLVGVYDQPSGLIRLYVENVQQYDDVLPTSWHADGQLHIGRGRADRQSVEYWPGRVDDVRLYSGALSRARVETLRQSFPAASPPPTLPEPDLGLWTFDEGTGNTASDGSEYQRHATIHGGSGDAGDWKPGRRGRAAWFNGATSYAQTAEPVVRDGESFSATAWVYLSTDEGAGKVVLGQDGAQASSFLLGFEPTEKRWSVVVPETDTVDPATKAIVSTEPAWLGEWTHLGVVYDKDEHELRLFVNGVLVAQRYGVTIPASDGPFTIGRGKWNGANMGFFPRGIDDVRVFSGALSDGEIRLVHDSASWMTLSSWRFDDGTGRDYTGRAAATVSDGASFVPGISGQALALDGESGAAVTAVRGLSMRDSFTVSAWAKLSRRDQVATVLGQDGSRMSGFVLQYRPENGRWVFGSRASDTDGAALTYAASAQPAVLNRWVQLTGVYDRAAQQVRLYVDGQLSGTRNHLPLWAATGGFTIGRGVVNGEPAEFFPGVIDEARADLGMVSDDEIARRAGWSAPQPGTLGVFVNAVGDRYTAATSEPVRAGYRFERTLGTPVQREQDGTVPDGTHVLYACQTGTDLFTSTDAACGGQVFLGEIGLVHTTPPEHAATVPIYRCATDGDRFDAVDCGAATEEVVLGYAAAYAPLARYRGPYGDDHWTTVDGTTPGYLAEGDQGWVPLVAVPGTQPLMSCRADTDTFTSVDPACEGAQVVATIGHVWAEAPPELLTYPLYRCLSDVGEQQDVQRFTSLSETCGGHTVDRLLGHVLAVPPVPVPGTD
ncbi:LamG-like jellyroll fold domain-containing protein [Actinophytocola gossypii]|uniref:LamG domain-containing protein n=1 Tax=Actinophytocola gossypii TaxID=2812003 RepID=A0ABT2JK59_9PSEU|nr:LamG-like jellyroll fold domain-containing protein [Actinophytocola gossypii]MCT2587914.1 LamG domain-containing protein [Actinophytocola gossypii]